VSRSATTSCSSRRRASRTPRKRAGRALLGHDGEPLRSDASGFLLVSTRVGTSPSAFEKRRTLPSRRRTWSRIPFACVSAWRVRLGGLCLVDEGGVRGRGQVQRRLERVAEGLWEVAQLAVVVGVVLFCSAPLSADADDPGSAASEGSEHPLMAWPTRRDDLEVNQVADHPSSDLIDCSQIGSHNLGGERRGRRSVTPDWLSDKLEGQT
jgi:hypothetical protein